MHERRRRLQARARGLDGAHRRRRRARRARHRSTTSRASSTTSSPARTSAPTSACVRDGQLRVVARARPQGMPKLPGLEPRDRRQRARPRAGQGRARAAPPRGARRATLATRASSAFTPHTITDRERAARRARTRPPPGYRGRPRGVRRGLLLHRRAGRRRPRPVPRGARALDDRRAFDDERDELAPTVVDVAEHAARRAGAPASVPALPASTRARPGRATPAHFQRMRNREFLIRPAPRPSFTKHGPRRGDRVCGDAGKPAKESSREQSQHHEGPPQDPGALLGADVRGAGRQVPDRLHVREGPEEGPAQAGPALLLPDGGGEGQPRLRRDGRRHPRQHVPPGPGALDGVAEALPLHHPVPGDLRRPRDAAGDQRGARTPRSTTGWPSR